MAIESPGHTLGATALVHEAYVRLVGPVGDQMFANRGHFFAATAEACAGSWSTLRRKQARKRGGDLGHSPVEVHPLPASPVDSDSWLDLDAALTAFETIGQGAA